MWKLTVASPAGSSIIAEPGIASSPYSLYLSATKLSTAVVINPPTEITAANPTRIEITRATRWAFISAV